MRFRRLPTFRSIVPFAVTLGASLAALVATTAPASCTSGEITPGLLPDGGGNPSGNSGGGADAGATLACAFDELDTFACPDLTLASAGWTGKCVDNDDCGGRVSATVASAGCQETTTYANVQRLPTSCATWKAGGGAVPAVDDAGAPAVCAPGAVTSFSPTWHPPRPKSTSCDATQIGSYIQCLTDSQTTLNPASCAEWNGALSSADLACLGCLRSNEGDPSYGPLVFLPTELLINLAGCIALAEGKADGSGCGGALQADEECQRAACLPSCPTGTSAQAVAEQSCETQANALPGDASTGGVCAAYVQAAECAGAIAALDAGTPGAKACFGANAGVNAELTAVALAFCGP
jgi:hypothetical protein